MPRARYGEIEGMREAREALQKLSRATQGNVSKRILKAPATVFIRRIKARAAVSSRPSDLTKGSLRESVHIGKSRSRKGGARMELIADDIASVPNEFGTSKMAAQPFFRPGIDGGREEAAFAAAEATKSEVDAAVARAAKKKR